MKLNETLKDLDAQIVTALLKRNELVTQIANLVVERRAVAAAYEAYQKSIPAGTMELEQAEAIVASVPVVDSETEPATV